MLIRSADKKTIVNLSNVNIMEVENLEECSDCGVWIDGYKMAGYETEERATEVLDEICNAYISLNDKDRKAGFSYVKNGVFQMPEV